MATSFTEAVALGVAPLPHNRPFKAIFEYTGGQTIILTDQALRSWWEEYVRNYAIFLQVSQGPTIPSEDMQEAFSRNVKGNTKHEPNE